MTDEQGMPALDERLLGNNCKSIHLPGQPRDFSGRGILMKNTLRSRLLDERDCGCQGFLGPFRILPLDGHPHFFNRGLHRRSDLEIPESPFFILPCPFNGR